MNKVKILSIISVGLLVANLLLIGFLVLRKPPHRAGGGPKKMVIEKLQFDENQIKKYEKMITWHRTEIQKSEGQMLALKHQLYATLTDTAASAQKDSLIAEIGRLQVAIENIHYKHFQDIKSLCTPAQQPYFEDFTEEITRLFPRTQNRQH